MKTLYLDNYKGFSKTFLPLADINFFVGENSTGKTAILNLLNVISRPQFWFNLDFNDNDIELGYFEEIAKQSQQSDKKYFEIGIELPAQKEGRENLQPVYQLLHFVERDGVPFLESLKVTNKSKTFFVHRSNKSVKYRTNDFTQQDFAAWISNEECSGEWKTITIPWKQKSAIPFAMLLSIISEIDTNTDDDKKILKRGFSIVNPFQKHYFSFAPIRAKARRIYENYKLEFSPEGEHIPIILKSIISSNSRKDKDAVKQALFSFGQDSALFDEIQIKKLGQSKVSPFEINITYNSTSVKITNVGYGVSQILPLLIEPLTSKNDFFSYQQPEVHLHPKAQAAFGEFLLNSFLSNKNSYVVETHSDYLINRFRYKLSKTPMESQPNSQVVFFERTPTGTTLTPLLIGKNGNYPDDLPNAYSSFFFDEELRMLEM